MTDLRETPEWSALAETFIKFVHKDRPCWLDGSEARGFGETVGMIDLSKYPGEECELCNGRFGTDLAIVHSLKINEPIFHPVDKIEHYAHVECVRKLLVKE